MIALKVITQKKQATTVHRYINSYRDIESAMWWMDKWMMVEDKRQTNLTKKKKNGMSDLIPENWTKTTICDNLFTIFFDIIHWLCRMNLLKKTKMIIAITIIKKY